MNVNINEYRICKDPAIKAYEKEGLDGLSLFCVLLSCPLIAALHYCMEEFGEKKELKDKIKELKKFYGYDKVVGYESI